MTAGFSEHAGHLHQPILLQHGLLARIGGAGLAGAGWLHGRGGGGAPTQTLPTPDHRPLAGDRHAERRDRPGTTLPDL